MSDTDIQLGDEVTNTLTNTKGHVTAIAEHITGCTRIGVRTESVETTNTHHDTDFYYPAELDVDHSVEHCEINPRQPADRDVEIELGAEVKDSITGVEGVVTTITHEMYNCSRVGVNPVADDSDGYETDTEWFDVPRVVVIGEQANGEFDELAESDTEADSGAIGDDLQTKSNGLQ